MAEKIWISPDNQGFYAGGESNVAFEKGYSQKIMDAHNTQAEIDHPDLSVSTRKLQNDSVTDEKIAIESISAQSEYGEKTLGGRLGNILSALLKMLVDAQGGTRAPETPLIELGEQCGAHFSEEDIHLTAGERAAWNNKAALGHRHDGLYESLGRKNQPEGYAGLGADMRISHLALPLKVLSSDSAAGYYDLLWQGEGAAGECELFLNGEQNARMALGENALIHFDITLSALDSGLLLSKTWRISGDAKRAGQSAELCDPLLETVRSATEGTQDWTVNILPAGENLILKCAHTSAARVSCVARGQITEQTL